MLRTSWPSNNGKDRVAGRFPFNGPAVGRERVREALAVALRLLFDTGECPALLLGLDRARRGAVDVQQVVDRTALERELAHGHARPGAEVRGGAVLHDPAGIGQLAIDLLAGARFRLGSQSSQRVPSAGRETMGLSSQRALVDL